MSHPRALHSSTRTSSNYADHPRTFIIIGLLRSGLDPEELSKQGKLF
jgi:hypothetical protein